MTLVDDALQLFHERDYDGSIQTFLKYKITQADIDRGRARGGTNNCRNNDHDCNHYD